MVVAVVAVGMVQHLADEVVDVIAMRDRRVAARRSVRVIASRQNRRSVPGRVFVIYLQRAAVDVILVRVVQVPVVDVVDVIAVVHSDMAAIRAVRMWVIGFRLTGHTAALLGRMRQ
jgi:hypothetical protein